LPLLVWLKSLFVLGGSSRPRELADNVAGTADAGLTMLRIETVREDEGRWLGEIPELPGATAYGAAETEARTNTIALTFQILGERIAHDEPVPINVDDYFVGACS
jgi:predicted RNase H-like HicB family nuclease